MKIYTSGRQEDEPWRTDMSTMLDDPLDDEELEFLDAFLLARLVEDIQTSGLDDTSEGNDQSALEDRSEFDDPAGLDDSSELDDAEGGIYCLSELDGFLTAIVSGPETVLPSRWLPVVWGELQPEFDTEDEAEQILSLIVRHMNSIARHLIEEPETFEPLFFERELDDRRILIVDEWCEGYLRGVELSFDAWSEGDPALRNHLMSILAFSEVGGWTGHEAESSDEVEQRQLAIAPSVRAIHAYWLARRTSDGAGAARHETVRRTQQRIGRNEPCPCGSGKKYKKCCLQ